MSSRCEQCAAPLRAGVSFCGRCSHPVVDGEASDPRPHLAADAPWVPQQPTTEQALPTTHRRWWPVPLLVAVASVVLVGGGVAAGMLLPPGGAPAPSALPVAPASPSPSTSTASPTSSPSTATATATDREQLEAQVRADTATVASLLDSWVPQVSSKALGTVDAQGVRYGYPEILNGFLSWSARYREAVLLQSEDFASFRTGGYWVIVVPIPFGDAASANRWCDQEGLPLDDCFAKRLSLTAGPEGSTEPR